jgi:phage gp36-like protein
MPVLAGTCYATKDDLGNLGLLGAALVNVPAAAQSEALLAASALADSYLQGQYVLPITQWGYDLVRIVCSIAAWDLLASRGYSPEAQADQNIRQRYVDALVWLNEVSQSRQAPLGIVDSSVTTAPSDGSTIGKFDGGSVVSSPVRGWTDRGVGSPADTGDWWRW